MTAFTTLDGELSVSLSRIGRVTRHHPFPFSHVEQKVGTRIPTGKSMSVKQEQVRSGGKGVGRAEEGREGKQLFGS